MQINHLTRDDLLSSCHSRRKERRRSLDEEKKFYKAVDENCPNKHQMNDEKLL